MARSKIQPFESEVKMLKGSERVAECSFTMFSMLPAKRDLKISTTGGGTPKRRHIGPKRAVYVSLSVIQCYPSSFD